jgi:hypothetical protein
VFYREQGRIWFKPFHILDANLHFQILTWGHRFFSRNNGGEGGIRTHVTIASKHAFQACAFSHSATSPLLALRIKQLAALRLIFNRFKVITNQ